jgi:hypothetical protein
MRNSYGFTRETANFAGPRQDLRSPAGEKGLTRTEKPRCLPESRPSWWFAELMLTELTARRGAYIVSVRARLRRRRAASLILRRLTEGFM